VFNIKQQPMIDVHLLGAVDDPHTFEVTAELVDQLDGLLDQQDGVLRIQWHQRTIRFPRSAIAFIADYTTPDMRQARVDLHQDASGRVYLADPETGVAHLVRTLALAQFGNDCAGLLAGDVELSELVDMQRTVSVEKLWRIAEYPHRGLMQIVGHLAGIKLSESARKYIGPNVVAELAEH
jgi:hypothetical protein